MTTSDSLLNIIDETHSEDGIPSIIQNSPYYTSESMLNIFTDCESFKILSLNCQSLNSKFDQLKIYIEECYEAKFDAICLQETWLNDNSELSMFQLKGYNLISKSKTASEHGGVAIYLKDNFRYTVLPIIIESNLWESLFIEVYINDIHSKHLSKSLIISSIYRPPRNNIHNYRTFITEFDQILHNFQNSNKEVALCGDFNIDLLRLKEVNVFNEYFDTILSNGFVPKITLPSRITAQSSTLIDNIFIKLSNNSCTSSGILLLNISDHFPCFITLDYINVRKEVHKTIRTWPRSEKQYINFKNEISENCTLEKFDMNISEDPNRNYERLHDIIQAAYEKHIPMKIVKYKKYKHKKTKWITQGIISSINFRDKMYKRLRDNLNNPELYNILKANLSSYNVILKKLIREAKKSYYESCFKKFKDDIKKMWDTIKTILNKTKKTHEFPSLFLINGSYISDKKKISDEFNNYFTNIGPNLASQIQLPNDSSFKDYLQSPCSSSFNFERVESNTICKIIDNLKPKSSCGIDHISNKLLKLIKNSISIPLAVIINQSIENGIFPERLKVAKIIPLFKKDEDYLLENYRPISVLPSISKVFERVIHNQLSNYFCENNLFYDNQYGFRKSHSTELATLELIDRVINSMDNNEIPIAIFLDFSKAFDTIDHEILLYKLKYYGINNNALQLLQSYLSNRKQYTVLDNVESSFLSIKTGVPQGSILGPLLFIIYVNDLHLASKMFQPVIYADDTTLSASLSTFGSAGQDRDRHINNELNSISHWLKLNKLSLNSSKTKAMLFHNPRRNVIYPLINIDQVAIEFVDTFNYLGIIIDKNLSWKSHISKMTTKLSKTIGIMCRLKNLISSEILRTLYSSLFLPYINYGILCWKSKLNSVVKLQKKAIRILANEKYNAHTEPIFKQYNLLKVSDIASLQELKFAYKLQNNLLPAYFQNNLFVQNLSIHNYNTRSAGNLHLPRIKHEFAKNSIQFLIPMALNNCPACIKDKISTHSIYGFSKYTKLYYINNYNAKCTIRNCFVCN